VKVGLGTSKKSHDIKNRNFPSLEAFAAWAKKHPSGADDGHNFTPAPMANGVRSKDNALPTTALNLDIDKGLTRDGAARLFATLERYRAAAWETRKSTEGSPRVRVVVESESKVDRDNYGAACKALAAEIGEAAGISIEIDESCAKPEQLLFTPIEGRDIRVYRGRKFSTRGDARAARTLDLSSSNATREESSTNSPLTEGRRNATLTSIAGTLRRKGFGASAIEAGLRALNATGPKPLPDREVRTIARSIAQYPRALAGPGGACATWEQLDGDPYEVPVIVDDYLVEDAGGVVAPGGTGKSTLLLYESVHIALGRALYGKTIRRSGPTLYISAEDSRDVVFSRLNWICRALQLSKEDKNRVRERVFVEDASDTLLRIAKADRSDTVEETELVTEICEKYARAKLSMLVLDPVAHLGPGERYGNDGMAEMMRIGRKLSQRLRCAVRYVHHVGQGVARGGIVDQYAGRGGTAFADNSRVNHQLVVLTDTTLTYQGAEYQLLGEIAAADFAAQRVLALYTHKLSYRDRDPTPIALLRRGFAFHQIDVHRVDDTPQVRAARTAEDVEKIVDFVTKKLQVGIKLSLTNLGDEYKNDLDMSRDEIRKATRQAVAERRLEEAELPRRERQGRKATYLRPVNAGDASAE
jgi:hypothetical protein